MVLKVIEVLKEQPDISQEAMWRQLGITRRVVPKYINALKEEGRIERIGGKRPRKSEGIANLTNS